MKFQRSGGILLHPTSLPGKFGIGSLGEEAFTFIDFLISTKQKLWQVLPLGPTGYGDSPYQSFSTFAGNPLLINLEKLLEDGLLQKKDLETSGAFNENQVDYGKVITFKFSLYKKAFEKFRTSASEIEKAKYEVFCNKHNKHWLDDYALYTALKNNFNNNPWHEWEDDIKLRKTSAINKYKEQLKDEIEYQKFLQYEFFKQWYAVKNYANANDIKIIGDVPIFVAMDSCDAWANSEIFYFDERKKPTKVAGVPPDYFSETGQLWGNPLYNWSKIKETDFKWWVDRTSFMMGVVDVIRIDHFRGFAGYWAVPYGKKDAIVGEWEKAPGEELFSTIKEKLGNVPIIAEDLGLITPDVEALRDKFEFPGMKILQFAFDPIKESVYVPHRIPINSVVYTGTHDNDTTVGWYEKVKSKEKEYIKEYLNTSGENIAWDLIRSAWSSTAVMAITPMQDLLSLNSETRMNTPGAASGNWQWRYKQEQIKKDITEKLKRFTKTYRR